MTARDNKIIRKLDSGRNNSTISKSQRGFTLIELAAVVAITGILVTLIASIFIQIVQSNVRSTLTNDIRESGQFMIETLVRSIRGAEAISGANGETVGKVLSIKVTTSGSTDIYAFSCLSETSDQVLLKNGAQVNTTKIQVAVNCSGAIDVEKSYFELIPPTSGAPAAVKINLALESGGNSLQKEFVGRQTLTQLVTLRTYAR